MKRGIVFCLMIILTACGESEDEVGTALHVRTTAGLKIFVTSETHNGDFQNDATLTGANAIEKADDFCNSSSTRPDAGTYKALLVDGVNRDAPTLTDWVMQPNTAYYRIFNNIRIGVTDSSAIMASLENTVYPLELGTFYPGSAYSGIDSQSTFATGAATCSGWSSTSGSGHIGGTSYSKNFGGGSTTSCFSNMGIYCVEQP